jgi:hypothetical protein
MDDPLLLRHILSSIILGKCGNQSRIIYLPYTSWIASLHEIISAEKGFKLTSNLKAKRRFEVEEFKPSATVAPLI